MNTESSLDRFLRNRAAVGLGLIDKTLYSLQGFLGGLLSAFGISMVLAPAFGASPQVMGGAVGALMAGGALLVSSMILKRRYQNTNTDGFKLSPEAKGLLLKLVRRRLGWFDGGNIMINIGGDMPVMGQHTRRHLRHTAWDSGDMGMGWSWSNNGDVSPVVLELLDVAAEQFNRIQGILQTPPRPHQPLRSYPLPRWPPRTRRWRTSCTTARPSTSSPRAQMRRASRSRMPSTSFAS